MAPGGTNSGSGSVPPWRQRNRRLAGTTVAALSAAAATLLAWTASVAATRPPSAANFPPIVAGGASPPSPPTALTSPPPPTGLHPTSRVPVFNFGVCKSGVVARRSAAVCPCYFYYALTVAAAGPTFNVTLSLSPTSVNDLTPEQLAAAQTALAAASAVDVAPATPTAAAGGGQLLTTASQWVRLDLRVTVDMTVEVAGVPASQPPCPVAVRVIFDPVEPTCPRRDIGVEGDGQVVGDGGGDAARWLTGAAPPRRRRGASAAAGGVVPRGPPRRRLPAAATARVVGGTPLTDPPARAFVVRIRSPPTAATSRTCTGSLLSRRHVLTAAHCNVTAADVVSVLPAVAHPAPRSPAAEAAMTALPIARVLEHPQWGTDGVVADVAIVVLAADVPDAAANVTRPFPSVNGNASRPVDGSGGRVAGFGFPSQGWAAPATEELSVDVRVVPTAACRAALGAVGTPPGGLADLIVPAVHVCAGIPAGGCDTCNGDSGGALYQTITAQGGGVRYVLVGLTSFGAGCAQPGRPSVYVRLSAYAAWIAGVVAGGGGGSAPGGGRAGGGDANHAAAAEQPDAAAGGGGGLDGPAAVGGRGARGGGCRGRGGTRGGG